MQLDDDKAMMERWQEMRSRRELEGVVDVSVERGVGASDEFGFLSAEIKSRQLRKQIVPESGKTLIGHIYKRD